jgi:anaerobic ribonucleoside-triphosphate reductase
MLGKRTGGAKLMICPECGEPVIELRDIFGKPMCENCNNKDTRLALFKLKEAGLIESDGKNFWLNIQK